MIANVSATNLEKFNLGLLYRLGLLYYSESQSIEKQCILGLKKCLHGLHVTMLPCKDSINY